MRTRRNTPRAFTLTELIIVVTIIVVLISLIIPVLSTATNAARQADSLNALRQMGAAHNSYSAEHKMRLIPGYLDAALLTSLDIDARRPDGTAVPQVAAQTWVWRLAPYANNSWQTFFRDFRDETVTSSLQENFASGGLATASMMPSFGMNSIFVGGDSDRGGPGTTKWSPWNTSGNATIAATRLSEVKNPANLILFGPSTDSVVDPVTALVTGHSEFRAPFLNQEQWTIGERNAIVKSATLNSPAGLPIARFGGQNIPIANLDGSAAMTPVSSIMLDMRRWAPFADTGDWRVPP